MVDFGICNDIGARFGIPGPSPPIPSIGRPFVNSGFIGAIREAPFVLLFIRIDLSEEKLAFLSRAMDSRGNAGLPCIVQVQQNESQAVTKQNRRFQPFWFELVITNLGSGGPGRRLCLAFPDRSMAPGQWQCP